MTNNPNKTQLAAINHTKGPSIVIAGAGTGKTFVITQRIIKLIEKELATTDEILALTFTNKASEEMSERVDKALPLGSYVDWILTFHSFCERILKHNAIHFDLDPDYQLINQIEAIHLFKENIYKFSLSTFRPSGNKYKYISDIVQYFSKLQDELISPSKLLNWSMSKLEIVLNKNKLETAKLTEFLKEKDITKDKELWHYNGRVSKWNNNWIYNLFPELTSIPDTEKAEIQQYVDQLELARVFHEYSLKKNELNVLDFGDMVFQTIRLFETKPNILEKYRNQFKYTLIDEFQDTNLAQYYLVKLIVSPNNNVMVVGDDDQSIYRFRGASISNILTFQDDYPNCKKYILTQNYRSTQPILDIAYKSISNNNPNRLEIKANICKKLESNSINLPTSIIFNVAKNDYNEAIYITKEIVKITGIEAKLPVEQLTPIITTEEFTKNNIDNNKTNTSPSGLFSNSKEKTQIDISDITILSKSLNYLDTLIKVFNEYDIPYRLPNTQNLLTTNEVKFVLSFLKAVNDIYDTQSFLHLISNCFIKIKPRDQILINQESKRNHTPLILFLEKELSIKIGEQEFGPIAGEFFKTNMIEDETIEIIQKIFKVISEALIQQTNNVTIEKIVMDMLHSLSIPQKLINIDTLESTLQLKNIERFIRMIQNYTVRFKQQDIDSFLRYVTTVQLSNQPSEDEDEYQNTEGVNISTIHRAKGLEFNTVFVLGLANRRLPGDNRGSTIDIPDELLSKQLVENSSKKSHIEEERRLFYVALTRAKQHLYVGYAQNYSGNSGQSKPSIFLTELGINLENDENPVNEKTSSNSFKKLSDEISVQAIPNKEAYSQKAIWDISNKSISYTQIQNYKDCPYKFKLSSILKVPIKQSVSLYFGTAIHETLRQLFTVIKDTNQKLPLEKGLKIIKAFFKPYMFENLDEFNETIQRGEKTIKSFYNNFYTGNESPLHLETSFNVLLKDIVLNGKIDRIDLIDGNKYKIIDYKTGKLKDEKEIKKNLQLKLYAYGIEKFRHIFPTEISFIFVEHEKEIITHLNTKDLNKIEEELISEITPVVENIKGGNFEATPSSFNCAYCSYQNVCEYSAK